MATRRPDFRSAGSDTTNFARSARKLDVGVEFCSLRHRDFLEAKPPVDWVEVRTENYLGDGGFDLHVLETVRCNYPLSFHGSVLSPGSAMPLDATYLARAKALVERFQPVFVSEHLCWSAAASRQLGELLPLPFTRESVDVVVRHVDQIQTALKRIILLENIASPLRFRIDEMTETEFFGEVIARTGCAMLLDLVNLHEAQGRRTQDAVAAIGRLLPSVREIHLGGRRRAAGLADGAHRDGVPDEIWMLYRHVINSLGHVPTLIEWSAGIPSVDVLLREASEAWRMAETPFGEA